MQSLSTYPWSIYRTRDNRYIITDLRSSYSCELNGEDATYFATVLEQIQNLPEVGSAADLGRLAKSRLIIALCETYIPYLTIPEE